MLIHIFQFLEYLGRHRSQPQRLKIKPLGVQESEARVLEVVKVVLVEVRVVVFQYSANLPLRDSPDWSS